MLFRSGGPYTLIAGLEGISDVIDSKVTNGKRYYYVVKAVNAQGLVSAASAEVTAVPVPPTPPQTSVSPWINEFHYDNTGTDTGEFFEIAGSAGFNLSGWTLVAYNGANGQSYATVNLSGVLPNQQNGYGTLSFALVLQNGAPDGFALVSPTNVVLQFLSYEGTMTATNGPASGMTSTPIPTSESEATPVGYSLQLQGAGNNPGAFTWSNAITATPGQPNTGQTLRT